MNAELVGTKRRWAASAIGAVVVMGAMLFLLRVPTTPTARLPLPNENARPAARSVELAKPGGVDRALADEAAMQDQRPLFLPTSLRMNIERCSRPRPRR